MFIKRFLDLEMPENTSCFLWGARQTGKSLYLKKRFPKSKYIDLLKADIYMLYFKNPERLRHEIDPGNSHETIIIDEIQKIPALLDEVHYIIETNKGLRFIMRGSSIRKLKYTGANLLGGRAWRYMFTSLCYPEIKELNWNKIFNQGLLPGNYTAQDRLVY